MISREQMVHTNLFLCDFEFIRGSRTMMLMVMMKINFCANRLKYDGR